MFNFIFDGSTDPSLYIIKTVIKTFYKFFIHFCLLYIRMSEDSSAWCYEKKERKASNRGTRKIWTSFWKKQGDSRERIKNLLEDEKQKGWLNIEKKNSKCIKRLILKILLSTHIKADMHRVNAYSMTSMKVVWLVCAWRLEKEKNRKVAEKWEW